ncbi:MAG: HAD family hydrolase [Halobaculum sp.]
MAEFDAVAFDLDGTVVVDDQGLAEIHAGVFERVDVEPFFEPADMRAVDFHSLPEVDGHGERAFYEAVYRAVIRNVGGDPSLAPRLAAANVEVVDHTAVSLREGAETALAAAADHGPVGLVTNGERETQTTKLDAVGVRDAFDAECYCHAEGDAPAKPDPAAVECVAAALDTTPERTVLVGDSLHDDVVGADAAGAASVWVPRGDATDGPDPTPDYRLDSLADLPSVL